MSETFRIYRSREHQGLISTPQHALILLFVSLAQQPVTLGARKQPQEPLTRKHNYPLWLICIALSSKTMLLKQILILPADPPAQVLLDVRKAASSLCFRCLRCDDIRAYTASGRLMMSGYFRRSKVCSALRSHNAKSEKPSSMLSYVIDDELRCAN